MLQAISSYIKYLVVSKSKYKVHSPFVYDFLTKALEKPVPISIKQKLVDYRNDLLADSNLISVTDFGSGSKVFKSNERRISDMVKHAGISKIKAKILLKIMLYYKPKNVLELGTSLGISAAAISIASPSSKIKSIEGCPQTAAVAKKYIKKYQLSNISIKIGEFFELLPSLCQKNKYDLIYFDGNHQYDATINYFKSCLNCIHNDTLFIFDDIHWSKEMERAWETIKKHDKVKLTIDLYHFGVVFFRKEIEKQDFILKV